MSSFPFFESLERRSLLSGVTFITHGQGGTVKGDVTRAANLMAQRAGGASQFTMRVTKSSAGPVVNSFSRDSGSPNPDSTANGEIIVKVDWSDVSVSSTTDIAAAISKYLLTEKPTGHSLLEQEIALAGPSRGASVFSNLAQQLGRAGVWVDQLTFIDPVPLPFYDQRIIVTDNVIFSDNYWRTDGNPLNGDFDGDRVEGSHNSHLDIVQRFRDIDAHSSVAAYYLATIDPNAPIVSPALSVWFKSPEIPRDRTGFYYSRIVGGPRPTNGLSPLHGGRATRVASKRSGSQWSNVDDLTLTGGDFSITAGQALSVSMRYDDVDSTSTLSLYLDRDKNPYNNNSINRIAHRANKKNSTLGVTLAGSTVEAPAGTYYLYAQIRDKSGHTRYSYINRALKLTRPTSTDLFASVTNGALSIRGTSKADRITLAADSVHITATRGTFSQQFSTTAVSSIVIDTGAGDDTVTLSPNAPAALILGGRGNDTLTGGNNNDTLAGGIGNDRLVGNAGNDHLLGSDGNDILVGGAGADRLNGGPGRDVADKDPLDSRASVEANL